MGATDERAKDRFLQYPTNRILGVLGTPERVESALRELTGAGVEESRIEVMSGEEGVRRLDRSGRYHGLLARMLRLLQRLGEEQSHLQRYEEEINAGHYVISIPVDGPAAKLQVRDILKAHRSHYIHYYRAGSIEDL